MTSLADQIKQENQDLAEIQKVARMTPKKMFWQWVNVAGWFVFGIFVSVVLNMIMGYFVPEKSVKTDNKEIQTLVFECIDKREKSLNDNELNQKLKENLENICKDEIVEKLTPKTDQAKKWFEYSLNQNLQDFLKDYIFIVPSLVILGLIFAVLFFFWFRSFWNQISANFLQITKTEKLIFAGYGFWVGMDQLGLNINKVVFGFNFNFQNLTWNLVFLVFFYFSAIILFIRFFKVAKNHLLTIENFELFKEDLRYYQIDVFIKVVNFVLKFIFLLLFSYILYNIYIESTPNFYSQVTAFLISFNLISGFLILQIPKMLKDNVYDKNFYNYFIYLLLGVIFIIVLPYSSLLDLTINLNNIILITLLILSFYENVLNRGVSFLIVSIYIIVENIIISKKLVDNSKTATKDTTKNIIVSIIQQIVLLSFMLILGLLYNYFFLPVVMQSLLITANIIIQIIISKIITNILKQAKQKSIIKAEEPLDDFDELQKILGKETPFLVAVENFTDKKILSYPHQNLQNRSHVYAIDGIWGSGKSTFIKLAESLISKEKEFKLWENKSTPSAKAATSSDESSLGRPELYQSSPEGNFIRNPIKWFFQWSGLGYRQGEKDIIWIDFNPWNYIAGEKLIMDFFDTLENRISQIYGNGFHKIMSKYVSLLISTKPSFLGVDFNFEFNPLKQDQDLAVLKDKISERLSSIKEKIVIVIDDIDRLPPEIVLTVLRLVGISANFPNIIFILAMDYDKVEKIVQKELGEQYQNYLQKIVNERVQIVGWKYKELEEIFNFYTKEAIERFTKLEGLGGMKDEDLLSFKVNNEIITEKDIEKFKKSEKLAVVAKEELINFAEHNKTKIVIFENYMVKSFLSGFRNKIYEEVQNKNLVETSNNNESLSFKYHDIKISFAYQDTGKTRAMNHDEDMSFYVISYNKYGWSAIFSHKENLEHLNFKFGGNSQYPYVFSISFKDNTKQIFNLIKYGFSYEADNGNQKDYTSDDLTSVHQTPRDIKQLANNYIYAITEIYDSFEETEKTNPNFSKNFIDKLQTKLPEIVEETVAKQMFKLT
jgi:hypothetical protein